VRGKVPWRHQIEDTIEGAKGVAHILGGLKLKLAIENHETGK